jgi:NAD-dependent dihydropyrimidine dehydrogenase PreA subunit
MKALQMPVLRIVLYEGAGAAPMPDSDRLELFGALLDAGHTLTRATPGVGGGSLPVPDGGTLLVLGRFGGAEPRLQDAAGQVRLIVRDIEGMPVPAVLDSIAAALQDANIPVNRPGRSGAWKPWFPVIDYDRCTNCMQCLSFCLFDVYGVDTAGKIQVQNNDNCKTDCPACSRVCPEVAILFPKYTGGPINGDVVRDTDVKREAMKVDISALLGGDIYSTLKQRHDDARQRFARERDDKRALTERLKCLTKLQSELDIPMEVLTSLPSAGEIRAKAEQAKLRAQQALDNLQPE